MKSNQMELVSVEQLISEKHTYRKLKELLDFDRIIKAVKVKINDVGAIGYGKTRLVICMILQFVEDLSDREFQRFINENVAGKWFCGFSLLEKTPDYSTMSKFRTLVGTKAMKRIFDEVKRQLKEQNYNTEVFTFVDSSALISKLNLWEERDKAIAEGYEKLNNEVLPEVSADPEAKIGSKNKNKFWYGFKKHTAVDMGHGFITDVSVTPANVPDAEGVKEILPNSGAVVGDKGYVAAIEEILRRGLHPMIILRNNMKDKIAGLDKWISQIRAPFEGTFSKQNKRVRYKGTEKNQGAEYLYAVAFNFRRLLAIDEEKAKVLA